MVRRHACSTSSNSHIDFDADKNILDEDKALAISTRDNSIMWNMARGEVSFVVWLYSVVLIRDGMRGNFNSQEVQSWYTEVLRKIRQDLNDEAQRGKFSDHFINALACMQATSVSANHIWSVVGDDGSKVNLLQPCIC